MHNGREAVLRATTLTGLSIPADKTFSISWTSDGDAAPGSGSRRQIGISQVSVAIGSSAFAPSLAATTADYSTLTSTSVSVSSNVTSDGGSALTARGFVYAQTSVNAAPEIGGTGVTIVADGAPATGAFDTALAGLSVSTGYSVRGYATNAQGTSYSGVLTFVTLAPAPSFTGTYSQPFDAFMGSIIDGTLPAGWTVVSTGGSNAYAGNWGPGVSSAGLLGNVSDPGVLGYQHTGSSLVVTKKLTLVNGTGAELNELFISYRGRVSREGEGRSPIYTVTINGEPVAALS